MINHKPIKDANFGNKHLLFWNVCMHNTYLYVHRLYGITIIYNVRNECVKWETEKPILVKLVLRNV